MTPRPRVWRHVTSVVLIAVLAVIALGAAHEVERVIPTVLLVTVHALLLLAFAHRVTVMLDILSERALWDARREQRKRVMVTRDETADQSWGEQ